MNHVPITMAEMLLEPGAVATHEVGGADNGFLYVLDGRGRFGAEQTTVAAGQAAWLAPAVPTSPSELVVAADTALRALFWAGPPLGEPVVARGPFVMNTQEQIVEAHADYRAGRF